MAATTVDGPRAVSIIGGVPVTSDGPAVTRRNPARPDEVVGAVQGADRQGVAAAVSAAAETFADWRARSAVERAQPLARLARLVEDQVDKLAALITAEEGKTLAEARGEAQQAAATFALHAEAARRPDGEVLPSAMRDTLVLTRRVPIGVVAAITPWNFPLVIPAWKLAPALVAGNTVVWKPASHTSLVASRLVTLMTEAGLPPGVCNLLLGGGDIGAALVADERVGAVTFTGSEATGASVAAACAARRARCQLELGGHSPAIVFADADLDVAAACIVTGFASGSGQKCTATRRIIVAEAVREALIERLSTRLRNLVVGDGADPRTDLGPLISAEARDAVEGELSHAVDEGAELVAAAGPVPPAGHFVAPTLLASTDATLRICREEVFGPVATLLSFREPEEGVALANATRFGLAAAVFTTSLRTAHRSAEALEAGILKVNAPTTGSEIHAPFGGTKASSASGYREQGFAAREFFTETRTTYLSWPG